MPNHCSNELVIHGSNNVLEDFQKTAVGRSPWVHAEMFDGPDDCGVDLVKLQAYSFVPKPPISIINKSSGWYDYNIQHLGTKWGAYDIEVFSNPEELIYTFDTAWGPFCNDVLRAMSNAFPSLLFDYRYDEPGAEFDGRAQFRGGHMLSEDYEEGDAYRGLLCGAPEPDEDGEEAA